MISFYITNIGPFFQYRNFIFHITNINEGKLVFILTPTHIFFKFTNDFNRAVLIEYQKFDFYGAVCSVVDDIFIILLVSFVNYLIQSQVAMMHIMFVISDQLS